MAGKLVYLLEGLDVSRIQGLQAAHVINPLCYGEQTGDHVVVSVKALERLLAFAYHQSIELNAIERMVDDVRISRQQRRQGGA